MQDAEKLYRQVLDKLQLLDHKTYLQVISKCPLLSLDTSLWKGLQMATLDTRTLTRQLVSFTTLLDEVIMEATSSGGSKPRRFLPSFKAARKRKATAAQLLDVAEALQVILSTLAQHQNRFQGSNDQPVAQLRLQREKTCDKEEGYIRASTGNVDVRNVSSGACEGDVQQYNLVGHGMSSCIVESVEYQPEALGEVSDSAQYTSTAPSSSTGRYGNKEEVFGPPKCSGVHCVPPLNLGCVSTPARRTATQHNTMIAQSMVSSCWDSDESECSPQLCDAPTAVDFRSSTLSFSTDRHMPQSKYAECMFVQRRSGHEHSSIPENVQLVFGCKKNPISSLVLEPDSCVMESHRPQPTQRECDGFFTARSHFSPPRGTLPRILDTDFSAAQSRGRGKGMKGPSDRQSNTKQAHPADGCEQTVQGMQKDNVQRNKTDADSQMRKRCCAVTVMPSPEAYNACSARQSNGTPFSNQACRDGAKSQETVDPWQQICDLWEQLTGQVLNNADDAAPIPSSHFVTKLCHHFLGREPSDVEWACIMDVQNPYGYKNILFSDFVECIQYLGPMYALETGFLTSCQADAASSENMLTRFFASVINQQTQQVEPWFRPDISDHEKAAMIQQASPGQFLVKCSRFHSYFEVMLSVSPGSSIRKSKPKMDAGTHEPMSIFIKNSGQGHVVEPTDEMHLPEPLLAATFITVKQAVQALQKCGVLGSAVGQATDRPRRTNEAEMLHQARTTAHMPPPCNENFHYNVRNKLSNTDSNVPKLTLETVPAMSGLESVIDHALETERTRPLRRAEQDWPTDWQYSFAARLLGKSPRDYHSTLEEMSDRGHTGLEEPAQDTWLPAQSSWRVHLWDQSRAQPPSGQGTPECSPCKSSLVPSNQSSPVQRTPYNSDMAPVCEQHQVTRIAATDKYHESRTGRPSTTFGTSEWQHGAWGGPRSQISACHHDARKQHGTRKFRMSYTEVKVPSPAHMGPDPNSQRDTAKVLAPNSKSWRKDAPQHVHKIPGRGDLFALPMKAAFGYNPPPAHQSRITPGQFSMTAVKELTTQCERMRQTSPPRISHGAGFAFKLPVHTEQQLTQQHGCDQDCATEPFESNRQPCSDECAAVEATDPKGSDNSTQANDKVHRCAPCREDLHSPGALMHSYCSSAIQIPQPVQPQQYFAVAAGSRTSAMTGKSLTISPSFSHTSTDSEEVVEESPKMSSTLPKSVTDLANELSPIPSNEPYGNSDHLQQLSCAMAETDSDDETLRAQSGDESSDSRHVSESEGEEACPCSLNSACPSQVTDSHKVHAMPQPTRVDSHADRTNQGVLLELTSYLAPDQGRVAWFNPTYHPGQQEQ
eukprot:jgi/Ulvmu1/7286/UM035_0074.1